MKSKRIFLRIEPFTIQLETDLKSVIESIQNLYSDYIFPDESTEVFVDFHIQITAPNLFRRFYKPQVQYYVDGKSPFKPLPMSQSFAFFEWGLNWVIASHVYNYLILHAAVVEKKGNVLILCGLPGAGKSTLCAALVSRGWRLFSDEMAIINNQNNQIIPFVRPISLKNNSIDIIKQFSPDIVMGQNFLDTAKGTVSHMKPPKTNVLEAQTPAIGKWIVFPHYVAESETKLLPISKGETVIKLAENSFNYNVQGGNGFNTLCELVENSDCYTFTYSQLDEAIALFSTF
jgi:HprK-related kinase A